MCLRHNREWAGTPLYLSNIIFTAQHFQYTLCRRIAIIMPKRTDSIQMRNTFYYSSKKIFLYRLLIITSRTVLFFFLFSVMMFALFVMGNYQNFTDKNVRLIIKTAVFSSIFLCIFSAFNIFCASLFFVVKRRKRYIVTALFMFLSCLLGLAMAVFLRTVEVISRGIP